MFRGRFYFPGTRDSGWAKLEVNQAYDIIFDFTVEEKCFSNTDKSPASTILGFEIGFDVGFGA